MKNIKKTLLITILMIFFIQFIFSLSTDEIKKIIKDVDNNEKNFGDFSAEVVMKQSKKNKEDKIMKALVFRQDLKDKFMIIMTDPNSEKGKGYLEIDDNLWFYDPNTGKWDRRTERERINDTDARSKDHKSSDLLKQFDIKYLGEEKLGKIASYKFQMTAKKGVDVAYPILKMWIEKQNHNPLMTEEYSLSNKLMRVTYDTKWTKVYSKSKKANVWYPKETLIDDKIENSKTLIIVKKIDLSDLPVNMFTKAWVESKSR